MGTTEKCMTVGVLEDELVKVRQGLNGVIKAVKAMDRRALLTHIAAAGPKPCVVVQWNECCYGGASAKLAKKNISPALHSLALCLGRLARYIDAHDKP